MIYAMVFSGGIIKGNRRVRRIAGARAAGTAVRQGINAAMGIARQSRTRGSLFGTTRTIPKVARGSRKLLKSRGGSSTITRRRKLIKDAGNMSDYSKVSATYGRTLPILMKTMKLVSGATERTKWSWRNLNKFAGTNGAVQLKSLQPGVAGTIMYMPVHLYDLTSVLNATDAVNLTPNVGYELRFSNETATNVASWGLFSNGIPNTTWTPIDAPGTLPQRLEGGTSFLDAVSIKLLLYGATAQPNKFKIDICQFDESFVPDNGGTVQTPVARTMTADHTAFWQYMTKSYCYNPIDTMNTKYYRNWKVLKSMVIEMDPRETSEASGTRYKEVRMYYKMNRKLNYRWLEADSASLTTQDTHTNLSATNCYVQEKARVFLMIRALSPINGPSGVSANANTPSYDIVIEKTHLNLSSSTT